MRLVYLAQAGAEAVNATTLDAAMKVMSSRAAEIGVTPVVQRSGADEIAMTLPDVPSTSTVEEAMDRSAQLYFYAWEPNVIGATGEPEPAEGTVTGDASNTGAGGVITGLTEYQAILRASKRPLMIRSNDTTYTPGCTPAQANGCRYGSWYLLGNHEQVLGGPSGTKQNLDAESDTPESATRAVRVPPGTVLVQALPVSSANGRVVNASPNSWYVLNDDPTLSGADIRDPQQGFEEALGGQGQPIIHFGFTTLGKHLFERMTKEIAARGKAAQLPGVSKEAAEQHFAVVLDGQLLSVPSINYANYPQGISATNGSAIASPNFTAFSAQVLADELRSGPLPLRLTLISSRRT